jgi:fatty acid desaturase
MSVIRAHHYLSAQERKTLLEKSDWRAFAQVAGNWAVIGMAFALVYFFTNIFTVIIALFVIGGKQLGCSVIMHDASHNAMFTDPKVNDFVGKWFGAFPIFNDMIKYRPYHWLHHISTGSEEDPDLSLTKGYPTTVLSMGRKFFRDLSGLTGVKAQIAFFMMQMGYLSYNLAGSVQKLKANHTFISFVNKAFSSLSGPIISNLVLWFILYLSGAGWLYWLWIGALFTTYNFSIRVRSIAEHSIVDDTTDPLRNTRTTYANWIEKLLFAPNNVNYHLEHHMLMTVPSYNLPKMHQLLLKKGFYEKALLEKGYWKIIRMAAGLEEAPDRQNATTSSS